MRIMDEVKRQPEVARDGTATWSLSMLQRRLRQAPDGLPAVSTSTMSHWRNEGDEAQLDE